MAHGHHVVTEHRINIALQQYVRVHQQESVGQQVPQLLHRQHVLVRAVAVDLAVLRLRVFGQLFVEVDHLALGVVDHRHALHLLGEGPLVRVVENGDVVLLSAVLADAVDTRLGQFGGVVVHDCYFLGFHLFLVFLWFIYRQSEPGLRCRSNSSAVSRSLSSGHETVWCCPHSRSGMSAPECRRCCPDTRCASAG